MTQLLLRYFIPLKSGLYDCAFTARFEQVIVESSIFFSKFDNLIANWFMLVTFIFSPVLDIMLDISTVQEYAQFKRLY